MKIRAVKHSLLINYLFLSLTLMHQPFVLYKVLGVENIILVIEYILISIILAKNNKVESRHNIIPLLGIAILVFPISIFSLNFQVNMEFAVRLLPVILFLIFVPLAHRQLLIASIWLIVINIFSNVIMFMLLINGSQTLDITLDNGMTGVTIGYLSFGVSTAYFTTADPVLARLQGWAWEPAAFALSALPVFLLSKNDINFLGFNFPRSIRFAIFAGLFLTKSIAFFMSAFVAIIANYFKSSLVVFVAALVVLLTFNLLNADQAFNYLSETSLDVRVQQAAVFFNFLTLPQLFFGAGYASENDIGMNVGQTSVLFRYILYFGVIRLILILALIYFFVGSVLISKRKTVCFIAPIFIGLLSLDVTLSSMFLGTFISSILLFRERLNRKIAQTSSDKRKVGHLV